MLTKYYNIKYNKEAVLIKTNDKQYKTTDGQVFFDKDKSGKWETILRLKKQVESIPMRYVGCDFSHRTKNCKGGKAFYITSQTDLSIVCAYLNRTDGFYLNDEHHGNWPINALFNGNDWYIFYWKENGLNAEYWIETFSKQQSMMEQYLSKFE